MKDYYMFLLLIVLFISCKKGNEPNLIDGNPNAGELSDIILKDYFVTSIAFDKTGTAWLGTLNQGLVKYDKKATTVYDSSNSLLTNASIHDIKIDKAGNIWIGSDDLIKYDGSKFTRYDAKTFDLLKNHVGSIVIDNAENIWFSCSSYKSGGLVKFDGTKFTTYTPENSKLPGNLIQSMSIDEQDNIWMAINDGINNLSLTKISGTNMTVFGPKEIGFVPYYFGNIVTNKQNELLVSLNYGLSSTIKAGLPQIFKFDGNKSKILNLPDENAIVYYTQRIFTDKNDQLWASFSGEKDCGVYKDGKWTLKDLNTDGIFAFGQNVTGEIWLGTGNGVYILK